MHFLSQYFFTQIATTALSHELLPEFKTITPEFKTITQHYLLKNMRLCHEIHNETFQAHCTLRVHSVQCTQNSY